MVVSRSWVVAALVTALVAAGVAVIASGVEFVSAATRTGCEVTYTITSQSKDAFSADVRIRNTSSRPLANWSLTWRFVDGQRVLQGWDAWLAQSGAVVSARPVPWNTRIPANAHTRLSFTGTLTGSNPHPTTFILNGSACTIPNQPAAPPAVTAPLATHPASATGDAAATSQPVVTTVDPPSPTGPAGPTLGAGRIQYGPTYTGDGTSSNPTGAGRCSYEATTDRMIAAMNRTDYQNSQACGAYLAVTGPSGTTITVKIVDRCPRCKSGDIELSAEAFTKLAAPPANRVQISWKLISPALPDPVTFTYKNGSTRYWCGIQVGNHRNPVRSLEVQVDGAWKSLARQEYNYFLSTDGLGCGSPIRVTDIYGHQLVEHAIAIKPGVAQQGTGQFGAPD